MGLRDELTFDSQSSHGFHRRAVSVCQLVMNKYLHTEHSTSYLEDRMDEIGLVISGL